MSSVIASPEQASLIAKSITTYLQPIHGITVIRSLALILSTFTFTANVAILVVTARNKNLRSPSSIFIANMAVGDALLMALMMVAFVGQLANNGYGYNTTVDGCIVMGFGAMLSSGVAMYSLGMLAYDRFTTIVRNKPVTDLQAIIFAVYSWVLTFLVMAAAPLANHASYFGLKSSAMCCLGRFYDRNVVALVITIGAISNIVFTNIIIFFCYYNVIKAYVGARINKHQNSTTSNNTTSPTVISIQSWFKDLLRGKLGGTNTSITSEQHESHSSVQQMVNTSSAALVRSRTTTASTTQADKRRQNNELALLRKAVLIYGSFTICWSPFFSNFVYEVAAGTESPVAFNMIALICAGFSSAVNPTLNFILDKRYTQALKQLLGRAEQ